MYKETLGELLNQKLAMPGSLGDFASCGRHLVQKDNQGHLLLVNFNCGAGNWLFLCDKMITIYIKKGFSLDFDL